VGTDAAADTPRTYNVGLQTMHMGFKREDWITGYVAGRIGERRAVSEIFSRTREREGALAVL